MKKAKLLCVFAIMLCVIALGGCKALRPHQFSQSRDQIIRIEFIDIEEDGKVGPYNDCPTLLVIEPEQYDQLFSDFYEMDWWDSYPPAYYMYGRNLKITYANQEYELIGIHGYYLSNGNERGHVHGTHSIRPNDWDAFLEKYGIPPNIFSKPQKQ